MTVLKVVKNDCGYDIDFTISDANGNVVDISGATVVFKVAGPKETPIVSGSCTVSATVSGQCTYPVQSGDFVTEGIYQGELQLSAGTQILTARDIEIRVGGEL